MCVLIATLLPPGCVSLFNFLPLHVAGWNYLPAETMEGTAFNAVFFNLAVTTPLMMSDHQVYRGK